MDLTQTILLSDILEGLNLRERNILMGCYLYGYKEREMAKFYNISRVRIHQIKQRALEKCKEQLSVIVV